MPKVGQASKAKSIEVIGQLPFVTGSIRYGEPTKDSDIDLVILVSHDELKNLLHAVHFLQILRGEPEAENPTDYKCTSKAFRFGDLNLIVCTTEEQYMVWKNGTRECVEVNPCSREEAREIFNEYRRDAGIPES